MNNGAEELSLGAYSRQTNFSDTSITKHINPCTSISKFNSMLDAYANTPKVDVNNTDA